MNRNQKRKPSSPSFQNLLSKWSKTVRERDGNRCVVCGATKYLNAHHILPKKYFRDLALELNCGISLCPRHHIFNGFSAHMNSIWFSHWLLKNRPDQYQWCIEHMKRKELEQFGDVGMDNVDIESDIGNESESEMDCPSIM